MQKCTSKVTSLPVTNLLVTCWWPVGLVSANCRQTVGRQLADCWWRGATLHNYRLSNMFSLNLSDIGWQCILTQLWWHAHYKLEYILLRSLAEGTSIICFPRRVAWKSFGIFFSIWCVPKRRSFVLSGFIKRLHVRHQAAISCRSAARGAAAFSEFWTYLEGQVQFKIIYVRFQGTHVRDAWYIIYVDVKQCRSKKISLGDTTYHHLELWHLGSITNRLSSLQQIALKPVKWDIRKAKDS